MTRRGFLAGAAGLAGCARDRRPRLNVFNWSDYVAEDTIANFESEFGARVRYATFESNEEMLAKVLSGNSGWDVVFPSNYYIGPMRALGLLAEIPRGRLRNTGNLEEHFRTPPWDPELRYNVPYMWGSSGIAYNRKVSPAPLSWKSMWDRSLEGRITMLDDPAEVLGASLKKLGRSLNTTSARDLQDARREAMAQKPLLRAYLNAEVRDQLVAGDVLAAQLWATTAQQAIEGSQDLAFVFPQEGFALYADCAVVLRESRRTGLAFAFLDYLLRPEVAAKVVTETQTATANGAARLLLPESVRTNPTLYPPAEVLRRGEWFQPMPLETQRLRDRIWTEIKAS